MKELARYKNLIVSFLVVIVGIMLLRGIYSNYTLKLQDLAKEFKKTEEAKATIFEWIKLNSKYQGLRGRFLEGDTIIFKKLVEAKARAANIELPSLSLSRIDRDSYWEVKVRIRTVCSYKDFVGFVDSLAERSLEVVNASLSGSGTKVIIDADIKGVVLK